MATISQIKAARNLLNWKQADLARVSGMALSTIANMEQGRVRPRESTLQVIAATFEKFGVEFLGDHGVDLRPEKFSVEIINGDGALFRVWEDVESTFAEAGGGEVLLSNLDHQYMYENYKDALEASILRRPALNISLRGLVREGDLVRIWPGEEFRAIPRKLFSGMTPVYMYGNKTAMLNFKDSLRIVLIENRSITDAMRQQFEHFWRNGKPVSHPVYMG